MFMSRFEEIKILEDETYKDERPEKLDGESREDRLGCKAHPKNSKIFA
jgi:hypothetical protein